MPIVALSKSEEINFLIFLKIIKDTIKMIGIDKIIAIISDNPLFSKNSNWLSLLEKKYDNLEEFPTFKIAARVHDFPINLKLSSKQTLFYSHQEH